MCLVRHVMDPRVKRAGDTTRVTGVCIHHGFTFQTARRTSVSAPGNHRHPAAVRSCPPRNNSRRVKRRKALVRKPPHPVATLRSGPSLHRKGRPAHDADRRALRRFTAVIFAEPSPTRLGPRLRTGEHCSPAVQLAPSFRVIVPERRGPRRPESPVDKAGRAGTAPRSTNGITQVDALERAGMPHQ